MILAFATSAAAPGARRKQAAPVNPTPTLQSATVPPGGTTILLDFTVAVSVGAGGNGGWTVSLSGGACTLTYASGAGTDVLTYNLSRTITSSETGAISYTQPGNGIEATTGGNDVATISSATVTNNSTATAPTLSSATIPTGGTTISLVFSASVSIGAGGNGGVTVSMSGGAATLSYASGSGSTTLVYNINRTVNTGETGTISYTQPGNGIESTTGTMDVATFSGSSVTNSSTQSNPTPTLSSSTINTAGTTLTDVYSHSVTVGAGGNGGKTISMSGGAATASYTSGSGSTSIVYTLSRTVDSGETGTSGYTQPGNGLEATTGGNDVATYSGSTVTNNSTAGGNAFPLSYSDAVFTGMTNLSPASSYNVGASETISNKQNANDATGDPTVIMDNTCTFNYCRFVTREGPRMAAGSNHTCALNWCYVENYMVAADHSDGIQMYGAGGSPKPTLRLRNCHFKNRDGHVGVFAADAVQVFVDIEDCIFTGGGQFGLRLHDDIGSGAITLRMKNVYFTDTFTNDAIFINLASGTNPVTVTLWENVRWCTLSGSTFTPGATIGQPSGT